MADRIPNFKYEAILLERGDLVLTTDACLDPASFLQKGEENQEASKHNCLDIIEYQTKVRPDLSKVPLHDGTKLLVDGLSSIILDNRGERHNGYTIIDRTKNSLYEGGQPKPVKYIFLTKP